jgi:hypothetical protein
MKRNKIGILERQIYASGSLMFGCLFYRISKMDLRNITGKAYNQDQWRSLSM